ncbi:MAG: SAM-dependent chlorinase/fluorinase [Thermodesulfobacteriota bacterium]
MTLAPIITLTTDFGYRDNFAGVMKGVILAINPGARVMDLTHGLPRHDVASAAFSLLTAVPHFPAGAIHVAVVDPEVGSPRAIAAVRTSDSLFLAPDNGLLSYILEKYPDHQARQVQCPDILPPLLSRTFHGRDVLAPAAAHLALGFPFENLGPEMNNLVRLPSLRAEVGPDSIKGRVIYVDGYGNLITNIPNHLVAAWPPRSVISLGPVIITGLSPSYGTAPAGAWLAVAGSGGFLEIARNQGRAENPPALTVGTPVTVRKAYPVSSRGGR